MVIYYLILEYLLILKYQILGKFISYPNQYLNGSKIAICLIGVNENWYFLKYIADILNKNEYKIIFLENYDYSKPINKLTLIVRKYIKNNDLNNVILVGHSKGGIVARCVSNSFKNEPNRIEKVICIATPNQGTLWGYLRFSNIIELIPKSNLLKNLNLTIDDKVFNFYPLMDNHVIPNKNLLIPNSKNNVLISIVGHTRILMCDELNQKISTFIQLLIIM